MSLYEEVLASGVEPPPPKPPRASAAVVPWRRDDDGEIRVFWVERSRSVPFMPGWHAFPGGALHPADSRVPVSGRPSGLDPEEVSPMPSSLAPGDGLEPDAIPGIAACALRELFEETGVLPVDGAPPEPGRLEELRGRILDDPAAFAEALGELDLRLDVSGLVAAGRWLTPPFAPLRFDNRFFLLHWPRERELQPRVRPGELVGGEWLAPAAALERWRRADIMTAPPIVHLLTVLDEDGPEGGLARLREPEEADLGPHRRIEFRPGVVMLPLETPTLPPATHTNAYLLGLEEAILVDPGSPFPGEIDDLLAAVKDAERRLGRRVVAVWLTHHHPDHVGGVAAVRRALGVPVAAHPATAERLADSEAAVDELLEDGQCRRLGDGFEVRVVHTPGHARGHLAFHLPIHDSLVCGDLVSALSTIVIDPPEGRMADYLDSLGAALDLGPATLFPGHGPALYPADRILQRFLKHRRWREERILEAWRAGLREPAELVPQVYDDVPKVAWPLAARQIEAHLEHLRDRDALD